MIALTFDTDHMTEGMMLQFMQIIPPDLPYTFFCHRAFPRLKLENSEIAIHTSLSAPERWINVTTALRSEIETIAGPVVGLRPHSLMCSQLYLVGLHEIGIQYVSSITINPEQDMPCFRYSWGPIEVPIRYMDNMDLWSRDKAGLTKTCFSKAIIEAAISSRQLFCFDFHPVHIYLNTSQFADYEEWVREGRPDLAKPVERRDYGTRDFFLDLCSEIRRSRAQIATCRQAADAVTSGTVR
jgi:hypothetical protein